MVEVKRYASKGHRDKVYGVEPVKVEPVGVSFHQVILATVLAIFAIGIYFAFAL